LLVDGTCSLTSSFIDADLVDQAVAYVDGRRPSKAQKASTDAQRFAGLVSDFAGSSQRSWEWVRDPADTSG
jgi:riboflavin biosynthesis pyrimidine reductase